MPTSDSQSTVYSIGHSNHPLDTLLDLLEKHQIQVVADIRSYPHSSYSPHFDQSSLQRAVLNRKIQYVFLGPELGGRPEGEDFYDPKGHVYYGKVAKTELFRKGLERLKLGMKRFRVAILCSEEDPTACHRRLLVGRVLAQEGAAILHIRGNGTVQTEEEIASKDPREILRQQMGLFAEVEDSEWKSIPSVLQKSRQNDSLSR